MIRVRIAIPAYSGLTPHTQDSIDELINHGIDGVKFDLKILKSCCNIAEARCMLINDGNSQNVLQSNFDFDYILFIDDDIGFTPEMVERMIGHGLPIVSAMYPIIDGVKVYNAGYWGEDSSGESVIGLTPKEKRIITSDTGLIKVDWVGAGMKLVSAEVYKNMEYPWYYNIVVSKDDIRLHSTEDMVFCEKAIKAGYKIYVDCDIRPKHFKQGRIDELVSRGVINNNSGVTMKLTYLEIKNIFQAIGVIKETDIELDIRSHIDLSLIKKAIEGYYDGLISASAPSKDYLKYQEGLKKILIKYSDKDKKGRPEIKTDGGRTSYKMNNGQLDDANAEIHRFDEENIDTIKAYKKKEKEISEMLEESVDVNVMKINADSFKGTIKDPKSKSVIEALIPIIER